MALTDAQAKIINQTKKKKEERKKKAAASNPSVSSQNLTLGRSTSQLSPLQLAKQDAATKTTTRNKVDYAKQSKASINTQKSVQANKEKQAAKSQIKSQLTLSESDAKLPSASQKGILDAKVSYEQAKTAGDKEGMAKAHQQAEKIRSRFGYSGGAAGTEKIEGPGLTEKDKVTLNKEGQNALLSALTLGNKERAEEIRNAKGFQAVDHSRQKDGEGREVNVGALSKAQLREGERRAQDYLYAAMAAVPGSIMSAFETADTSATNKSVENNREYLQDKANRLGEYEAKLKLVQNGEGIPEWGSESWLEQQIRIAKNAQALLSKGEKVDTFRPGHSLLRESNEAAARAMEGMTGPGALLAKAGLSAAQMLPGVAASFIPGVGPALGATILGTQAAGSKMYELNEQTSRANYLSKLMGGSPEDYGAVTPDESLVRGVVSGAIEGLTERIPIGSLLKIVKGGGGANFLANIAKQAGVEATEESASTVLNHLADLAAQDPTASLTLGEVMEAAAVGAISGAGFGAGGSVLNSAINRNRQKTGLDTLLETAGVRTPETQQNEPEQMFEQPQQETPVQAETPVQGQERGEGVAETFAEPSEPVAPPSEPVNQEPQAEFEAMGAMSKGGAGEFARWQAESENFHPINEQAAAVTAEQRGRAQTEIPTYNLEGKLTSKTISTFANANILPNEMVTAVESNLADGAYSRIAYTDSQALQDAEAIIAEKGYQGAKEYWLTQTANGRINKANSTLGIALINQAANSPSLHVDAMDLLSRYADYAKDAGQALQAMNMINKLTPQGQLYTMVKAVEYMEERAAQNGNAVNVEINPELVTAFMEAETQQERNQIKQEMIKDAAAQLPATWRDRFDSWRYLSMLGNPRTHIRNFFGNAGFALVRGGKNAIAAGLERATGVENRTTALLNRLNPEDRARLTIARGEFPEVKELILSGGKYADDYSRLNQERDVWKTDNKLLKVPFKAISKASDFNSKLLDEGDVLFSRPAYVGALARYLKANNITAQEYANMLPGDTRKQEAQAHAIKEAQKATYRDTNAFSEAISRISKWRYDDNKAVRGLGYLAEGVLPFKKTPANILVRAVEYSPVGLGVGIRDAVVSNRAESWANKGEGKNVLSKKIIKLEKDLASNAKTPAEAIDELAAGLTGTGLLGLGMALGYLGIATGGASGDDKRDDFNELQGHQNYALEIGNRSLTLDWLAPEALPFFVGIELQKYIQQMKDGEATADDLVSSLLRIADPMLEMSMLQGLNDLFNTIGSDYALSSAAWTAATSYLTQFLPTLAGQIERIGEPVRETTFIDPGSRVPKGMQYLLGNIGNKIPGWDYNQVDYVDAWGRTEDMGNVGIRALNNLLNPAYYSEIQTGSTEAELMRLHELGYESVLPSSFQRNTEVNGERVSGDQWFNMQTTRGKTAKTVLDSFIGTEQYNAMTDDERAKFVKKVLEYGSNAGKVKGGADAEETFARWQEAAQNAKAEVGLSEAEIIAASAYQSVLGENLDDDVKASFKQGQFEQWVDSRTDLTEEQKSYIKDNIKFYSMIPANADRYNKVVDSGYSIERTEELLTARSEYADSNNGLYEFVISQESDYAAQEKLYNAFKDKGATKSWGELAKEQAPVSARIKKAQTALDEAVPAEKQTAFETAISDAGANSQKATKLALLSVDATDAERVAYYNLVSARKGWKKSYYQVDMS